jgi:hypothetical protein
MGTYGVKTKMQKESSILDKRIVGKFKKRGKLMGTGTIYYNEPYRVAIGIDPSRAWAVNVDRKLSALGTVKNLDALLIELARLYNIYSARTGSVKIYVEFPRSTHVYQRPRQSIRAMSRIAVNVGQNRAEAKIIINACKKLWGDANVTAAPPIRGYVKMKKERFNRLTGWTGKSSEHSRDAACLIVER